MNLNDFGLSLLDCINKNNVENKKKFMKNINEYKDKNEMLHNQYLEDISYYISNYENKRIENQNLYDEYLNKRECLLIIIKMKIFVKEPVTGVSQTLYVEDSCLVADLK